MVLRAAGFHHHTVDTLEVKTLDEPSMNWEGKPSGCLLTNNTRGDGMSLKAMTYSELNGNIIILHCTQFYCDHIFQPHITSAKTIKNCTGFDLSQFILWRVIMGKLHMIRLILGKY